jgi:ribose 5-phosphate isomerase B
MKIAIGADHGGFELKGLLVQFLKGLGHAIDDVGCQSHESVDYPELSKIVCEKVGNRSCDAGILICGTGIGMSLAANRYRNIRAALCHDEYTARMSREHNDANILCLGARVLGVGVAEAIVKTWLLTDFAGGRHQQRISQYSD